MLRAALAGFCVLTASYWLGVMTAGFPRGGHGLRVLLAMWLWSVRGVPWR